MRKRGFTVTELLVCLGVVAVLLALLLPAIQASREASRRNLCRSNLHQLTIALQNYESSYRMLPASGVKTVSWLVAILPEVDQAAMFSQVDFNAANPAAPVAGSVVRLYLCPSDPAVEASVTRIGPPTKFASTSYLGNSGSGVLTGGYNGVFQHFITTFPNLPEGPVRFADVSDGLSATAAVSECLHSTMYDQKSRLRIVWNLPRSFTPSEVEDFRTMCEEIPQDPSSSGWRGSWVARGQQWIVGDTGYSTYNHFATPMQTSCFNGTEVQPGIYPASSAHESVTHVSFLDGHIQSISSAVDAKLWAALGTRNGSESIQQPEL